MKKLLIIAAICLASCTGTKHMGAPYYDNTRYRLKEVQAPESMRRKYTRNLCGDGNRSRWEIFRDRIRR